jgi:NADH-quinone oxidoreductase subunit N
VSPEIVNALSQVFVYAVPETVLVVVACVLFLGSTFRANRHLWAAVALLGLAAAGLALWFVPTPALTKEAVYASPVVLDPLAWLFKLLALGGGALLILCSWNEVPDRHAGEYHACLLIVVAGMCLTGAANDLVTLFLALELISIPTYVMLYLPRQDEAAQEAAMKYFLLSIFSSAILLFGFSYLYGLTGTTNLPALAEAVTRTDPLTPLWKVRLPEVAMAALVLVVAGLGFRLAAVPFHFYAPDVYQGTPTSNAALLAFVPKVAGLAALLRVLNLVPHAVGPNILEGSWDAGYVLGLKLSEVFWILAAVSMTLGNLLALLQDNLKRLLAYSSVAHAGYMLIGLATAPHLRVATPLGGVEAVLFYLVAYGAMTIGAFAVIAYLNTPQRPVESVDDLSGLWRSHPGVALLMALFLFSLIGIPLTAGFAGKFLLFGGAMGIPVSPSGSVLDPEYFLHVAYLFRVLAFVGVINAAIGAVYYLRIASVMFLRNPLKPLPASRAWPGLIGLSLCGLLTVALGVYPWPLWRSVHEAVTPVTAQAAQQTQP